MTLIICWMPQGMATIAIDSKWWRVLYRMPQGMATMVIDSFFTDSSLIWLSDSWMDGWMDGWICRLP